MSDMLSPEARKVLHPGPCIYLLLTIPYLIRSEKGEVFATAEIDVTDPAVDCWTARLSSVLKQRQPEDSVSAQSYIGSTNNIVRRYREHNTGKARATRGRKWVLCAVAYMPDLSTARHVEQWFKSGDTRAKKTSFLELWQRHVNPEQVGALVAARVLALRPLPSPEVTE